MSGRPASRYRIINRKAFDVRDPNLLYVGTGPIWDPLRSDPRFQDLLRRMNLPTTSAGLDPDTQG